MEHNIACKKYFEEISPELTSKILEKAPYRKDMIFSEDPFSIFLKFYVILTYGKDMTPGLPSEVWYTSRYYYLKLYYHYYSKKFGNDAGIEQQIGKLIEEMSNDLQSFDWKILEQISKEIETIK